VEGNFVASHNRFVGRRSMHSHHTY
jgi:hypothetical protein